MIFFLIDLAVLNFLNSSQLLEYLIGIYYKGKGIIKWLCIHCILDIPKYYGVHCIILPNIYQMYKYLTFSTEQQLHQLTFLVHSKQKSVSDKEKVRSVLLNINFKDQRYDDNSSSQHFYSSYYMQSVVLRALYMSIYLILKRILRQASL